MTHGSLFTGLGGFDLAAEWMGWENIFQVEKEKHLRTDLKLNFPRAKQYGNIKEFNGYEYRGAIDIISGGDPCQPSSKAGLGKGEADERFLWPEKFRIVREVQPFAVVNENVDGTISNGILDWKIDDLESEGYTCQAYIIPAEAAGALHVRDRVWLVATNPDFKRQQKQHLPAEPKAFTERLSGDTCFGFDAHGGTLRHEIESRIMGMLNGLPEGMDYTRRNQRIAALGNAIYPEIAYQIFKAIQQTQ